MCLQHKYQNFIYKKDRFLVYIYINGLNYITILFFLLMKLLTHLALFSPPIIHYGITTHNLVKFGVLMIIKTCKLRKTVFWIIRNIDLHMIYLYR